MRKKTRRELRDVGGSLDGVTLTVRRTIRAGRETIPVGTDVTDDAKSWPRLRTLLKRGYLIATPEVDPRKVVPEPRPSAPPTPEPAPQAEEPEAEGGLDLSELSSSNTKSEIREALEAVGIEAPASLSKRELLELRDESLAVD